MAQETITIYRCDMCGRKIGEGKVTTHPGIVTGGSVAMYNTGHIIHEFQHTCYRCTGVINRAAEKLAPRQEKKDVCNNEVGID